MKGRLVKWDAAVVGENPPLEVDPSNPPQGCIEIIELCEGQLPQTIFRREDNAVDDSRGSVPR
jgi:hypothetical protein